MKKVQAALMLVFLLGGLYGQMAGKISGVITSAEGEPLAGANVLIEGTSLGAAAGVDGGFVILNVPVGSYTVKFSYIGYKDFIVNGVRVNGGLTTSLDAALEVAAIEGESVVVTAEKPLIRPDATSSVNIMDTETLENLPIRNLQGVVSTMPGVVVQDNNIHIRGGRGNEVSFFLNGANTTSAVSRNNLLYVPQEAIEEVQVEVGGYNAETGGANSGVIKRELKKGTPDFHGSFTFESDGTGGEDHPFFPETNSFGHQYMIGTLSGPILSERIQFFISGETNVEEDPFVKKSVPFDFGRVQDINPNNSSKGQDSVDLAWPGKYTPAGKDEFVNITGSLSLNLSPLNLSIGFVNNDLDSYNGGNINTSLRTLGATIIPDGDSVAYDIKPRTSYTNFKSNLITAQASFALSANTLLKASVNLFDYQTEDNDSWFGADWQKWDDSAAVQAELGIPDSVWTPMNTAWTYRPAYQLYGIGFSRPATANDGNYQKYHYKSQGVSASMTTQIGAHQIKAGVDMTNYEIRNYTMDPTIMYYTQEDGSVSTTTYGSLDNVPNEIWDIYAGGYGFDLEGNEIDERKFYTTSQGDTLYVDGAKKPSEMGAYLQDKIEFNDLVINAGVRVDVLDPDDYTVDRVDSLDGYKGTAYIIEDQWKKVDAFTEIQPRLGISFPVTDQTVVYGYYGRFSQLNDLASVYYSSNAYADQVMTGGFFYANPVGFGLEPIRTTQYEIGVRRQISDNAAFSVTGFYKNQKGLATVDRVNGVKGDIKNAYNRRVNGDFATHKGFEFTINMRRYNRLAGNINYTYTQAEGTGSGSTAYISSVDRNAQRPTVVSPLDFNQAHTGSVNLDYRFGDKDGGLLFQNFGANLLFAFSSGHAYTFVYAPAGGQVGAYEAGVDYMNDTRSRQALEPLGASTTPWTFTTDLRLDKTFKFGGVGLTAFVRINNLFDRRNVLNVYQRTGSADDDGFLSNPDYSGSWITQYGEEYAELYEAMNLDNDEAYRDQIGLNLYGSPRQVFFGIKLNF